MKRIITGIISGIALILCALLLLNCIPIAGIPVMESR